MSHIVNIQRKEAYTEMYRKNSLMKNIFHLIEMTHETITAFYIINTTNTNINGICIGVKKMEIQNMNRRLVK